ncbi:hypothetical protein Avbf_12790 [Armadillidium vulgare]|nr:hypothetical protein Avbf_12790 [Armadillidium vulgare]
MNVIIKRLSETSRTKLTKNYSDGITASLNARQLHFGKKSARITFQLASSMPLLDGAAVTILKEHNGDFGFQRMFANLGMMIMSPISGMLIDYFSIQNGLMISGQM